ncbi:Ig-like domain-containing protein [Glaesserella sp.]|uniref:Ig-like domain-containing protein n=1 Tax=Glaesserella sp. TaxID=2094731 RepID=UPI00359F3C46
MKRIALQIVNNKDVNVVALQSGKTVVQKATAATKYQLIDENGQLISNIKTDVVGDDLWVFVDGAEQPNLVLEGYQLHYPIQNGQYLAETQASFATAESASAAKLLATTATLSTTKLAGIAVGSVALATAGASLMSYNRSGHKTNSAVSPNPVEPTTPTEPTNPVEPITPTSPTSPVAPVTPSEPVTPTESPKPILTFDTVTSDNIVNIAESQGNVDLTGTVENAVDGSIVTFLIGDQNFTAQVVSGKFTHSVSGELLAKNNQIEATVTTPMGLSSDTVTHSYLVDVQAPLPVITFDPITTDDIIDLLEAQITTTTVSGSVKNARDGDKVVLTIGEATFEAILKDGKFSADVDTKALVVHQSIAAVVTTQDEAGNTAAAESSKKYTLDKVKYVPQVTIEQITADNIINISESEQILAIQGSATDSPDGSTVRLVIGEQTFEGTITEGKFSIPTSGELLAKNRKLSVTVITPQNLMGEATHTYEVDLEAPTLKINLNPISGDNHISTAESKQEFTTVTGTVDGASEGDEVIVFCGCLTCSGVQWVDMVTTVKNGGFSVDFKTVDLLKANYNIVKASVTTKDAAENSATAEDSETYTQPTPLHIDITKIDDFSFNLGDVDPLVRIKGTVEFEGDYAVGMNDKRLHQVDVTIGGKVYSAGFHNKQFFIDIRASELEALNGQAVSISFPIASGSWANQDLHNNVYRITAKEDGTYSVVMSYGAITPQVKSITFDSPHLVKETETSYKVNYQAEPQVEVSGQVIADSDSDVKVGDKIVVKVGDQSYDTTVQAGNLFSVMVDKSVLAKANQVTATLTTVDSNGVSIQVSDVENIISTGTVSGAHVITQAKPPATINNDHSTDGYNFPYFIQKLGSVTSAVNTVLGGKDTPLIYTYHFVTAEERAAGIESMRELPIKAGSYVDPDTYHANFKTDIRNAYKEIEKYINVKFVEVDTQAAADTNIYVAAFDGSLSGSAAYAWPGYNLVWNAGVKYDRSGLNFPFYTALHEIGHTLGMGHSGPTFKDAYFKEETLEFTNMSYRFGVDNGRYFNLKTLRMFDLAYLHHQFGVNKEARSGNDVYSFKAYNSYAADGDIYIWDGAGVDTFDASKETQGVHVNLTPGSWIYVGDTREQNLVVKGTKSYTIQEYFGLSADAKVTDNAWIKLGTTTFNEYTEGQAFIGYGTQIENLVGSEFNDTLTGNVADNNIYGGAGNDTIDGGAGNDYLDGGLGDDVLVGGLGDDTFILDSAADAILEQEGEGNDTVYSLANISLEGAANVENVILIGTTATEATGNALDNRLVANDIGNTLNGGAGNDRLEGGLGVDTLVGGDGSDTFVFSSTLNGKIDTIDLNAEDKIELSSAVFTAMSVGDNALDFIKLESGKLYYDSDKSGSAGATHFATLSSQLVTLENNMVVIV